LSSRRSEYHLILVDGYNLVHRAPELRPGPGTSLEESRARLVNLLSWAVGTGEATFLVVFDGAEVPHEDPGEGRVKVRYSRPPEKADDLIRRLVEDQIERVERLTVVTSDIEVARHARAMGADIALSDLFLAGILGPRRGAEGEEKEKEKPSPSSLSRKELEEWAALFRSRPLDTEEPD
jgi:predicted RNA-binding protein with PIN domain